MTPTEAANHKRFKRGCTCGGYGWTLNGRPQNQPHRNWCPQYDEYAEWWAASQQLPAKIT